MAVRMKPTVCDEYIAGTHLSRIVGDTRDVDRGVRRTKADGGYLRGYLHEIWHLGLPWKQLL